MRILPTLLGLLLTLITQGQTLPLSSTEDIIARRQRYYDSGRRQAKQDSLKRLFYQEPPYVMVSYSRNLRRRTWSPVMKLSVISGKQKLLLQPDSGNQFLLPSSGADSLTLGLRYRKRSVVLGQTPTRYFTHGATITFGYISRTRLRRRLRGEAKEYFRELFRDADPKQWVQVKSIRGIVYQLIVPRIYGDGVQCLIYHPILR